MSRHEKKTPSPEMRRELEAIDAAISGEGLSGPEARLGELSVTLRSLRRRPSEGFVRSLDARAVRAFKPEPPDDGRSRKVAPPRRWRSRGGLLTPAVGIGLTIVLVAVLAVSLSGGSGGRHAAQAPPARPLVGVSPASSVPLPPTRETASPRSGSAATNAKSAAPAVTSGASVPARQVERTSTLDIGVAQDSIQSTAQRVFTLASAFGGYVKQSNVSSSGPPQGGASFDIRLPSSKLPSAIAALSHLGHVRSENDTTNDVTDQLSSLRRSLGGLEAERSSLLRQLATASEAQQAASLKARLHAVEARVSRLQGAVRGLTARVDYTSLALSLTPESSGGAASGDLTPGAAAGDAAKILEAALAVLVIGAAAVLPLAVIVVAGWSAVALTRRRLREQALDAS
jgi:hypothetical protein